MRDGIQLAVQEAQLQLVPSRLDEISYFLAFSQKRLGKYKTVVWPENQLIQSLRAYPVSRRILSDLVGPVANVETESLFNDLFNDSLARRIARYEVRVFIRYFW